MKPRHSSSTPGRSADAVRRSERQNVPAETGSDTRGRSADKPGQIPKRGWRDILSRTKDEIKEDNLSIVAAGVAFYILLGIIPALAALISIYGLVADPATIQEQVSSMRGMLPPDVISIFDQQMTRIASESGKAGWGAAIGILLALWSGSKAVKALMTALNITYEEEETRGFFRLNLTALGLTFAGVIAVIIAVGLIVAIPIALQTVGFGQVAEMLVSILRWPLLAIFAIVALSALYRYAPDREQAQWQWVSWGAVGAAALWLAVSAGFSFYVSNFGSYNKTYGSLGAVIVLLLWFMISAYVMLLGAELNAEMEHQTARDTTDESPKPMGRRGAYVADNVAASPHKS